MKKHNNMSKAEIVVLCTNIKMSRKLKYDVRHLSAYKALDETINSHRKLESSIIWSTTVKDNNHHNSTTEH